MSLLSPKHWLSSHPFLSFLSFLVVLPPTMSSQQSFYGAVLGSFFGSPTFDLGICTDVCVDQYVKSIEAPSMVSTGRFSGADITDSSNLCRTLLGHAQPSTSATDLTVIRSVKVQEDFTSISYFYYFYRDEEIEVPPTLGNMRPSGYYAWDTKTMNLRGSSFLLKRSFLLQPVRKKK